jgi:hypothetical protein
MALSDDPSQVDTPTLRASLRRDIGKATALLREAAAFLDQGMATAWELERRAEAEAARAEPVVFSDPQDPTDLRPLHERIVSPADMRTPKR